MISRILQALLLVLAVVSCSHAFQPKPPISQKAAASTFSNDDSISLSFHKNSQDYSPVSLNLKNKSNNPEPEDGKRKQGWDFSLLFTYMTPWKNPNSIFVYMLLTLYCLGKYSEMKSATGGL